MVATSQVGKSMVKYSVIEISLMRTCSLREASSSSKCVITPTFNDPLSNPGHHTLVPQWPQKSWVTKKPLSMAKDQYNSHRLNRHGAYLIFHGRKRTLNRITSDYRIF